MKSVNARVRDHKSLIKVCLPYIVRHTNFHLFNTVLRQMPNQVCNTCDDMFGRKSDPSPLLDAFFKNVASETVYSPFYYLSPATLSHVGGLKIYLLTYPPRHFSVSMYQGSHCLILLCFLCLFLSSCLYEYSLPKLLHLVLQLCISSIYCILPNQTSLFLNIQWPT